MISSAENEVKHASCRGAEPDVPKEYAAENADRRHARDPVGSITCERVVLGRNSKTDGIGQGDVSEDVWDIAPRTRATRLNETLYFNSHPFLQAMQGHGFHLPHGHQLYRVTESGAPHGVAKESRRPRAHCRGERLKRTRSDEA